MGRSLNATVPPTVVSAEETATQVEVAFTRALVEDGKEHLLDDALLDELAYGVVPDNDERDQCCWRSQTTDHR